MLEETPAPPERKRLSKGGLTLIVLGGVVVVAIGGATMLKQIAMPSLIRARQAANEASAVASLKAILSAQVSYSAACGHGFYAPSLSGLGLAAPGETAFLSADLTSADTVVKNGYTFTMRSSSGPAAKSPIACNGLAAGSLVEGFYVTATPLPGQGTRAFGTNTTNTVYVAVSTTPLAMTDSTAPPNAQAVQ